MHCFISFLESRSSQGFDFRALDRRFRHIQRENGVVSNKFEVEIQHMEENIRALSQQTAHIDEVESAIVETYLEAKHAYMGDSPGLCGVFKPSCLRFLHCILDASSRCLSSERKQVVEKCNNDPVTVLELIRASVQAQVATTPPSKHVNTL